MTTTTTKNFEILPFQEEGVRHIEQHNGRALIADETGLGKTLQALLYAKRNDQWPCLVICPAIAKFTWAREAAVHTGTRATVLEGRRKYKLNRMGIEKLFIINYDILINWVDELEQLKPKLIIIDESQNIANPETGRTLVSMRLCKPAKHLIALSATPLVNRPIELFPTIHLLWPEEFPSRVAYGARYCQPRMQYGKVVYKGAVRLPELHSRLKACGMIRRKKVDVLKDLPPITREVIPLPIHDPKGEYKHATRDFLGWLAGKSTRRARRASRAEAIIKVGYLKRLAARLKFKYVIDWINNFSKETNEKLILFAWHKAAIQALHKRYGGEGVVVDGSTSPKHKDEAVWAFQHNKRCRYFIGNHLSASTNITLTAASNIAICELDWRPGIMLQCEGRPDRIGQTRRVTAWYLIAHDTIEMPICELVQNKQSNITAVLDGGDAKPDLDIFDLLIDRLADGVK